MYCSKCGKEIPEGKKTICEDCEKEEIDVKKEETENVKTEESEFAIKEEKENKKDEKKSKVSLIAIIVILIILVALVCIIKFGRFNKVGNSIGNIRNFGLMTEQNDKYYYVIYNEDKSGCEIYSSKSNGKNNKLLYGEEGVYIYGLNAYKNYIYFVSEKDGETEVSLNVCRMKLDGSDFEVINDNEIDPNSYEIYVTHNKVYYIGKDQNIYTMDLNGENKTAINSDASGFLGITDKYIFLNKQVEDKQEENEETKEEDTTTKVVTYYMNLDGSNCKEVSGERLYGIGVVGDDVYYSLDNETMNPYKTNLKTGETEKISDTNAYYMNVSDKYIYYLNYCNQTDIAIFRTKLNGTEETKIMQLDYITRFIDICKDTIFYCDNNEEKSFYNLLNANKKEPYTVYEYKFEEDTLEETEQEESGEVSTEETVTEVQ